MSPRDRIQFMLERDLRAGNVTNRNTFGGNLTPAQRDAMRRQRELALAKRKAQIAALRRRQRETLDSSKFSPLEVLRRRRRRPVGDPKPRRRVTPARKQVTQARKQVTQATQAPRTRRKPRRV